MEIQVAGHQAYIYTGGKTPAREQIAAQPVVVFIHGAQQDHSCWTLQSRWFAHHGYTTLVPDLPGHGRSGGAPLTSVEALADWIVALLDAAGIHPGTIRLSIGLEDAADLIDDLNRGLAAATPRR